MYNLIISGNSNERRTLAGFIVTRNTVNKFSCTDKEITFGFQHLSSARMMLNRIRKNFRNKRTPNNEYLVADGELKLRIIKTK